MLNTNQLTALRAYIDAAPRSGIRRAGVKW